MGWPCRIPTRAAEQPPIDYPAGPSQQRHRFPDLPSGRYSAAIMVVSGWSRSVLAARAAASKAGHLMRHPLITRNRRGAGGLAVGTVGLRAAAGPRSPAWFSPGPLRPPVLARGLLLVPRPPA